MHPTRRVVFLFLLCVTLLPVAGSFVLLSDVRGDLQAEFVAILDRAKSTYRNRSGIRSLETLGKDERAAAERKLAEIGREKRQVRLRIAALRSERQTLSNRAATLQVEEHRLARVIASAGESTVSLASRRHLAQGAGYVVRRLVSLALGPETDQNLFGTFLARESATMLSSLQEARESAVMMLSRTEEDAVAVDAELRTMEQRHEQLLAAYREADGAFGEAERTVEVSEERLAAIKRETSRVHADVLRLQGQLARIDAQIRAKAERALIEKGLMDPREGGVQGKVRLAQFGWPALGRITAGFHDRSYERYFGVPHEAVDIARPQGTPVAAATEGVVFLVRDGGATGYTYVLIGHRDGYATLYGHLSAVSVEPGQEVAPGQAIGLSGGQPGTPGAGLQTTGPHLHFEVIAQGINIDPMSVLPKR